MDPNRPNPKLRNCLNLNMRLLTLAGLVNPGLGNHTKWIPRVVITFFFMFHCAIIINLVLVLQLGISGKRTIAWAEWFQLCFDTLVTFIVFIDFLLYLYRVYPILPEMQRLFDQSDPEIQLKCQINERNMFLFTSIVIIPGAVYCYLIRIVCGIPKGEIQLAYNYEQKANPQKQLPFILWLPVDDTVPPTYYIMLVYNVLFLFVGAIMTFHLLSYLEIISIHFYGYSETIAKSLHQLGTSGTPWSYHLTTSNSNALGEVSFASGERHGKVAFSRSDRDKSPMSVEELRCFEDVKTILKQYQQYLLVRNKFTEAIKVSILIKNSVLNIISTVCLYQLSSVKLQASTYTSFQMVIQYLIIVCITFCISHSSELLDSGNDLVYKSLADNQWYNLRPDIAKLLIPMICVATRPKRFIYFGGTVDISNRSFLAVMRFSYSVFTLLKNVI
ncbi:hypothetical protein M8J76_001765 [Diaphorina citri]|nr:hypothetical protein M8J76_001765 [Diaphorina citri]